MYSTLHRRLSATFAVLFKATEYLSRHLLPGWLSMAIPAKKFTLPPRPPALPISKTFVYKTIGDLSIPIDVYLPSVSGAASCPIMLFIHGGGWIGANRSDYCRPLFHQFLTLGFVVTSMDYRLLPETSFEGQLEDIRDVEIWLRNHLPRVIGVTSNARLRVDVEKIIVVGSSAGAHLALFTPTLWSTSPSAILSMYGPTNMHQVPYLQKGRLAELDVVACTPDLLAQATDFEKPPTEIALPKSSADYKNARNAISLNVFRKGITAEFLVRGLDRDEDNCLKLPEKGSVSREQVNRISPLYLCTKVHFPPTYQVMGTADDIFQPSHVISFHETLQSRGVECKHVFVPGQGHAFDNWAEIGGDIHRSVLMPAVDWVSSFAGIGRTNGVNGKTRI